MAISDRITSIEEHIKESYQELEGIGIDTTGVNKNLENIPKLIDGYWETLPKVTGEGTSITLDNTKEGKMKINLKGNTSQATSILPSEYTQVDYIQSSGTQYIDTGYTFTSSKEKIDFKYAPLVIENARVCGSYISQHRGMIIQPRQQDMAEVGNTGITPTFSISANTDYKVMLEANEGNYTFEFGENSQTGTYTSTPITNRSHYIFAVNYTGTTTKATMKLYYYKMYDNDVLVRNFVPCYRNSDNEVGLYDLVNNVFYTNAGTGAFTYGAVATLPNPDYPQDIHVVSGDNSIDVYGKNLYSGLQQPTASSNEMGTFPSGTYTFSMKGTTSSTDKRVFFYIDDEKIATMYLGDDVLTYTFTLTSDSSLLFRISGGSTNATIEYIQLEKGSTATDYMPHQEQTYPINLGDIELCKIGDYQDSIVKNNGKWYLNKQIGKAMLDSTENWSEISSPSRFRTSKVYSVLADSQQICNYYGWSSYGVSNNTLDMRTDGIRVSNSTGMTLAQFKTFIDNNNVNVYYVLATPTYTEITDSTLLSQLEALSGAKSYTTQTNISQENNDNASILNATALSE